MPKIHEGYCANCKKYFRGYKKKFCSMKCRAIKYGKRQGKIVKKKLTIYKPENFDTSELDVMYNKQKMTYAEIGLAYGGLSANTIKKILLAKKFKLRKGGELASIRLKGIERSKEFCQKHIDWFKTHKPNRLGKHQSPEAIIKQKKSRAENGWAWTEEQRQKMSITWINKLRVDTEYLKKRARGMAVKPNKPETQLINLISKLRLPYKYTGDYKFWIEGRNPDFINTNGQKKIIDIFGKHWHQPKEVAQRKFLFGQYGYQTLILWDYELKNPEQIEQKLVKFDAL